MKYLKSTTAIVVGLQMLGSSSASASVLIPQTPLDPSTIPKYQDPLPDPAKLSGKRLRIDMSEFDTQILP